MAETVYGVALNDRPERERLAIAFAEPPYGAAPVAPVLYIKPATCLRPEGGVVRLPADLVRVELAPTWGLLFGGAPNVVSGVAPALEVLEPHDSFHRPAVRERCRDGFLPIGGFRPWRADEPLSPLRTFVDDAEAHLWSPDRLLRGPEALVAEISAFMTLCDGDVLLVGAQPEGPRVGVGSRARLETPGFAPLDVRFEAEAAE